MPATPRRQRGAVSAGFVGRQNSALNPSSCDTRVRAGRGVEEGGTSSLWEDTPKAQPFLPWSSRVGELPRGPEVHRAEVASPLVVSGEAGMHRFICHSQEYLPAPGQMPHTPNSISSSKRPCCLPSYQGVHGELEPMSGGCSEELGVQHG